MLSGSPGALASGAIPGYEFAAGTPSAAPTRRSTFLQAKTLKAIQKGRCKEMSLRAIERDLGIYWATIMKYLDTEGPPTRRFRAGPAKSSSSTIAV